MRVWDTPAREPLGPVEVLTQGEESLGRGWGGGVGRGDGIRYRSGAIVVAAQAVVILLFLLLYVSPEIVSNQNPVKDVPE